MWPFFSMSDVMTARVMMSLPLKCLLAVTPVTVAAYYCIAALIALQPLAALTSSANWSKKDAIFLFSDKYVFRYWRVGVAQCRESRVQETAPFTSWRHWLAYEYCIHTFPCNIHACCSEWHKTRQFFKRTPYICGTISCGHSADSV